MKKIFITFFVFLFFTSYSFSQSIEIKGKKIEDIKSILIDLNLQDGWTIENDTINSISFTKENKSTTQNLIFSFISGKILLNACLKPDGSERYKSCSSKESLILSSISFCIY